MRVLFVTLGGPVVPSSRIRVYQYLEALRARGWKVAVFPFQVSPRYERFLDAVRRCKRIPKPWYYGPRLLLEAGWRSGRLAERARLLAAVPASDLVYVQKAVLPARYRAVVRILRKPLVFDFDDAIFADRLAHRQETPSESRRRVASIEALARAASVVVTNDNPMLEAWARAHGRRAAVLPAAVETRFEAPPPRRADRPGPVLGWVGLRVNFSNLEWLAPALDEVHRLRPGVRLRVIWGGGDPPSLNVRMPVELEAWSYEREVDLGLSFDVGLLPLVDNEFNRGKMARKAIEYAALGTPSVCSPVGLNLRVFRDGENVLLARTHADWVQAILRLVDDPGLRDRLGRAAAEAARAHYAFDRVASRLVALLEEIAGA